MMWKPFSRYHRPVIGNPVLVETTFEEGKLETMPAVADGRFGPGSAPSTPPPGRTPGGGLVKDLPPLPMEIQEARLSHNLQAPPDLTYPDEPMVSGALPASTFQPTSTPPPPPPHRYDSAKVTATAPVYEISPPSSSGTDRVNRLPERQDSGRVSPIEETPPAAEIEPSRWSKRTSSIPVLRRAKKIAEQNATLGSQQQRAVGLSAPNAATDARLTRWDDFTSQRKSGQQQTPRSVPPQPGAPMPTTPVIHDPITYKAARGSGSKATFAERVRALAVAQQQSAHEPSVSDRQAPSALVTDTRTRTNDPTTRTRDDDDVTTPISSTAGHSDKGTLISTWEVKQPAPPVAAAFSSREDIKPTPPLKLGKNSPRRGNTPEVSHSQVSSVDLGEKAPESTPTETNAESQPNSRFSEMTADSVVARAVTLTPSPVNSTTPTGSARDSGSTVLNRPRPVKNRDSSSNKSVTINKTVANQNATEGKPAATNRTARNVTPAPAARVRVSASSSTNASASPKFKTLPQSPPEAESVDLISSLEAQLENLHTRRRNLERIIRDLNRLIPVQTNRHASWELDRKASGCKSELDEVSVQEHEIGLRLHRAWKRKDRQEFNGEPTGLWVRRVAA